jgi:REP element-mobilizing transposase RayT
LQPANRAARRVLNAKRGALDKRLARLVDSANKRRPPWQPRLTLEEAKVIASGLISSALARAQKACELDGFEAPHVFAAIVMSNHVHLVARAPSKNLARFVGYFKARVAMSINLLLGRTGNVWHRRYDAQAVLTDEAAIGRVRYVLANPQKARLVRHVDEWPGFVALAGRDEQHVQAHWFDWSAWHRERCPRDKAPFQRTTKLSLHKLPALGDRADHDYVRDLVDGIEPLAEHERVLGLDKVLDTDVHARPEHPKHARRPYAFGDAEAMRVYFEQCSAAYAAYQHCRERYLRGETVLEWPSGMYAPGRCYAQ